VQRPNPGRNLSEEQQSQRRKSVDRIRKAREERGRRPEDSVTLCIGKTWKKKDKQGGKLSTLP